MTRKKVTSPYISIRKSPIHNWGVFAKKNVPKGAKVIEYVGERVTKAESDRRADIPLERHKKDKTKGAVYIFELNSRHDIDGDVDYNTAKNINHSCDPNCETDIIGGRIWIIAIKDIKRGEEITYNYGYGYEDHEDHPCNCRTNRCMGYILSEDQWPSLKRKNTRLKNRKNGNNGKHAKKNGRKKAKR